MDFPLLETEDVEFAAEGDAAKQRRDFGTGEYRDDAAVARLHRDVLLPRDAVPSSRWDSPVRSFGVRQRYKKVASHRRSLSRSFSRRGNDAMQRLVACRSFDCARSAKLSSLRSG